MELPLFKLYLCLAIGVRSHGEILKENQPVSELTHFIIVFPRTPLLGDILEFLLREEKELLE